MSMIGYYYMVDEKELIEVQEGRLIIEDLIFPIYDEKNVKNQEKYLDIDKAWHAIHFVFAGEVYGIDENDIITSIVLGGVLVNDNDLGVRYITPIEVKEIYNGIKDVSKKYMREMFNVEDMYSEGIYPVREDEDEEEFFEYVWEHFKCLKSFFKKASENNKYILLYISI